MHEKGARNEEEMGTGETRSQTIMERKFAHHRAYVYPETESRNSVLETLAHFCSHQISVKSTVEICYHFFWDPAQISGLWPTTVDDGRTESRIIDFRFRLPKSTFKIHL